MAENDAPERIWMPRFPIERSGGFHNLPASAVQINKNDVEYVRADLAAPDVAQLANQIADALFRNGAGEEADRLVLVKDNDRDGHSRQPTRDLGGWAKRAVVGQIVRILGNYSDDDVRQARRETWEAAEAIAKERAQEYAARADTELAIGNQSNGDAWANWMKGAERTRQAIHADALRAEGEKENSE